MARALPPLIVKTTKTRRWETICLVTFDNAQALCDSLGYTEQPIAPGRLAAMPLLGSSGIPLVSVETQDRLLDLSSAAASEVAIDAEAAEPGLFKHPERGGIV
jgi:hypothetical protein